MVHKKGLVLTKEEKRDYEKGFETGFSDRDIPFFKNERFYEGFDDGRLHKEVLEKKELISLRNKMYKKYKRL